MPYSYNDVDEYAKRALEIVRFLVAEKVSNYNDREDQDDDIEGLKVKILQWSAEFHHTQSRSRYVPCLWRGPNLL